MGTPLRRGAESARRRRGSYAARTVVAVSVVLALLAGCGQVVVLGTPQAAGTITDQAAQDPEQVAEATATMLQEYWRAEFPARFGREWTDISALIPVHTQDPDETLPPCVESMREVQNQAFYCPAADIVAWDADGLIPDLHERFGPAGVMVVLAHEVGHAVQMRLGVDADRQRNPSAYPTILLEAMADCYAGAVAAHLARQPDATLPMGPGERDDAMRALVGFRDPVGLTPNDSGAHGNAFDRVSAFQDGNLDGVNRCADMTLDNRAFTQRQFDSTADFQRGGNLPLEELLNAIETDARPWFSALAPGFSAPPLTTGAACGADQLSAQGPVAYCTSDGGVAVDLTALSPLHEEVGDYSGGTLVAGRYAIATIDARGTSPTGPAAGDTATCLAGAYTGRLIDGSGDFQLSPGDLDEAVQVLLIDSWVSRDAQGGTDPTETGFDRIAQFRAGVFEGPNACLTA